MASSEEPLTHTAESIQKWMRSSLAARLGMSLTEIDVTEPVVRYGLDSLMATELTYSIEEELGVSLSMTSLLQGCSIVDLAEEILNGLTEAATRLSPQLLPASEATRAYPLSRGQQAMWFLHNLEPDSSAYNIAGAARIQAEVDVAALRRALQRLIDRHLCLRTTFHASSDGPIQCVQEGAEISFKEEDISAWDEPALSEYLGNEASRPFRLDQYPLLRATLLRR